MVRLFGPGQTEARKAFGCYQSQSTKDDMQIDLGTLLVMRGIFLHLERG